MTLELDLLTPMIAYHGTGHAQGGSGSGPWLLFVVVGIFATLGWLMFSTLKFRDTVLTTAGAWVVGLALIIVVL